MIKKIVLVFIEDLDFQDISNNKENRKQLNFLYEIYQNHNYKLLSFRFNSEYVKACFNDLFFLNVTKSNPLSVTVTTDPSESKYLTPEQIKLTEEELLSNNYILSSPDFVQTLERQEIQQEVQETMENKKNNERRLFALDCEMVLTSMGHELARISLLDFNENVLMDRLVKPQNLIIDYLTQYSGMTFQKLADVTTNLSDIQKEFLSIVKKEDILIGHSLENDLKALKIIHYNIIDSSVVFQHPQKLFKFSLKALARKLLNQYIQTSEHNSIEDARAALKLIKAKLENGFQFGMPYVSKISIFERLQQEQINSMLIFQNDQYKSLVQGNVNAVYSKDAFQDLNLKIKDMNIQFQSIFIDLNNQNDRFLKLNEGLQKQFEEGEIGTLFMYFGYKETEKQQEFKIFRSQSQVEEGEILSDSKEEPEVLENFEEKKQKLNESLPSTFLNQVDQLIQNDKNQVKQQIKSNNQNNEFQGIDLRNGKSFFCFKLKE